MTTITAREQDEIDRANRSGAQPVVFVHGLWLLPDSWDDWRALFEEQAFVTLAPAGPTIRPPPPMRAVIRRCSPGRGLPRSPITTPT